MQSDLTGVRWIWALTAAQLDRRRATLCSVQLHDWIDSRSTREWWVWTVWVQVLRCNHWNRCRRSLWILQKQIWKSNNQWRCALAKLCITKICSQHRITSQAISHLQIIVALLPVQNHLRAVSIAAALAYAACSGMTRTATTGQEFHGFGRYGSRYCGCSRWNRCRSSLGIVEHLCKSWTSDWRCALASSTSIIIFGYTLPFSKHWRVGSLVEDLFSIQIKCSFEDLQIFEGQLHRICAFAIRVELCSCMTGATRGREEFHRFRRSASRYCGCNHLSKCT